MNDFRTTLTKKQQILLSRLLPRGYSFELYKVRKNINDYPYKEFDKKYKKTQSIILNKKQSIMESIQPSQYSYRQKSQPLMKSEPLKKIQQDCLGILKKLKKHQSSYPFRAPVDPRALQIPDYFDIILEPIDLKAIQQNIKRDQYQHIGQFQRDIYKMIMNSYKYNQKISNTYTKTIQFQEYFILIIKQFFNAQKQNSNNDQRQIIKYQSLQQQKSLEGCLKQQIGVQNSIANLQIKEKPRNETHVGQGKIFFDMNQRAKFSKKQLPKRIQLTNKVEQIQQPKLKIQQPQDQFQYNNYLTFSQPLQANGLPKQQEQMIKDQMKSYIENETQNNRQQIFSQGYNQFIPGAKIPTVQVQRQISHLLKRLSQFPLTKQKKTKIISKFNNLEQNMTQGDKKRLYQKIFKLDENDIEYIIKIFTRGRPQYYKKTEMEIDLDKADNKVLREIQNFIALRQNGLPKSVVLQQSTENVQNPQVSQQMVIQEIKTNKKLKKQQKKNLKKKMSRKNSNDDSYNINQQPKKKKQKTQKQNSKKRETQNQPQDFEAEVSAGQQKSQSSYHPDPIYHSNTYFHGKNGHSHQNPQAPLSSSNKVNLSAALPSLNCSIHQSNLNVVHNNNNYQIPNSYVQQSAYPSQNVQRSSTLNTQPSSQSILMGNYMTYNNPYHQQPATNAYHQQVGEPAVLYDNVNRFGEIDINQYFSLNGGHHDNDYYGFYHNDQSNPHTVRSASKIRQPPSLYHLDLEDHQFHLNRSGNRQIPDDQIRQYSIQDHKDENQDEDQFY